MTVEFAIAYIPLRMKELGYGKNYLMQAKHLILRPNEVREINAASQFWYLVDMSEEIIIESEFGMFDITDDTIDEIQYEHQGIITITNTSSELTSVRFIQIIPKNKVEQCQ